MIVCDYLIANYDRHYRNFGAIHNIDTLKWMRIAPIFDSGSSLWDTKPTTMIGSAYKSKPFKPLPEKQLELVDDLSWLDISKLKGFEKEIEDIFSKNPFMDKTRIKTIVEQVKLRIETVIEYKRKLEEM